MQGIYNIRFVCCKLKRQFCNMMELLVVMNQLSVVERLNVTNEKFQFLGFYCLCRAVGKSTSNKE